MRATIINKEQEFCGQEFRVIEILKNRIACLDVNGKKIDFGMSELEIMPDANTGREILWTFSKVGESTIQDKHILQNVPL